MSTDILINNFELYLKPKYYNKIDFSNPNVSILFNTYISELHALIPAEHIKDISDVKDLCDYITIVSNAENKIDYEDQTIGIVYIDPKNNILEDSIVIVRLPSLQSIDLPKRKNFMQTINFGLPFWLKYPIQNSNSDSSNLIPPQPQENAKESIERAIKKYCEHNSMKRDQVNSYQQFIDIIAPELFTNLKITVSEEQNIRSEAEKLDKQEDVYPALLLQSFTKLGLLA